MTYFHYSECLFTREGLDCAMLNKTCHMNGASISSKKNTIILIPTS